jgi:hypothetical protein
MDKIRYSGNMTPIPAPAQTVLLDIMRIAGVDSVLVTSTTRTPADQARIMYDNLEAHGVDAQKMLYKAPGQAVIDVYAHCRALGMTADAIRAEMVRKIVELGPQTVSKHCAEPTVKSVFDVAPSSVPDSARRKFENLVAAHGNVDKFLMPPRDPCYHLELNLTNENSGEETTIQSL